MPQFKPEGPERDELMKDIFENILPNFLKEAEKVLEHGKKFLVGDSLNTCDFWIGCLYTNYLNNQDIGFGKEQFAKVRDDFPKFKAYGERFAAENEKWLKERPAAPI